MIETIGLTRHFDRTVAVENLSIRIEDGEVFGLLGPNGAGKTTTVRMLCCLIGLTGGEAYLNGLDVRNADDRLRIRGMIGLLPESPGLYESLSAQRNLQFFAKLYGCKGQHAEGRIKELLKALDIWDRREEPVVGFSKGMKQKIAIARALVHEPEFLFLDEPTSGLDPSASVTVRNYLLELKKEGHTIFLNTHNLDEAERLCDRIAILNTRLLVEGRPSELSENYFGRTISVDVIDPGSLDLKRLEGIDGVLKVFHDGDELSFVVDDPKLRAPEIIRELVAQKADLMGVCEKKKSLEEVYLKIIGGT